LVAFFSTSCNNNFKHSKTIAEAEKSIPYYDIDSIIDSLPDGSRWIQHLNEDLLPFWLMKEALGPEAGKFPSCRCMDGTIPQSGKVSDCSEFKKYIAGTDNAALFIDDTIYTRAQARQTYAYGIAFHLTGREEYLDLMIKGVDFLRNNAIDKTNGSAFTYYSDISKQWGPDDSLKISQDMAYALSGIGFYYYLTHDPAVLGDILKIKDYIFKTYYDSEIDMLKWSLGTKGEDNPHRKELVSQLDQIYGYMLWLTPSLPQENKTLWEKDLVRVAHIMVKHFFSEKYGFFWGTLTDDAYVAGTDNPNDPKNTVKSKRIGGPHTDFGHSIKTLWLIYQIGKMTNDMELLNFAKDKASRLIDIAYDKDSKCWNRRFDAQGNIDKSKEWWALAELDQTTATLSLIDPSYARYIGTTYKDWFKNMVDHKNHGIWHMVSENNIPDSTYPKQHIWKNAFHTFEHTLIGYVTSERLKGNDFVLHYAFKNEKDTAYIHPYFYSGKVQDIAPQTNESNTVYSVTFSDLY